jgi:hypothetical protein
MHKILVFNRLAPLRVEDRFVEAGQGISMVTMYQTAGNLTARHRTRDTQGNTARPARSYQEARP